MSQEKYIAAIEIGSSKITVAIGRDQGEGRLAVVALEQRRCVECVSHGVITNVEETASLLTEIIRNLERRTGIAPRRIRRAYVGLAGRSLRNVPREVSLNLADDTEITQEIISGLQDEALRSHIDSSLEVIDAVPCTYFVGKTETRSAIGTFGSSIRAQYQLIAARPRLRKHLERVVRDKAGIPIERLVITPLAVADLILSPEEKRLGCMLVDLGAETTTVAIYLGGALHYLAVLPMGGRNITSDITSLNILEERAEEIKTTSGYAILSENPHTINIDGVKMQDVDNLVAARAEEIVANIVEQINYAGLKDRQLPGGIVTIGAGFNLNRMGDLLKRQSNLNVRRGTLPSSIIIEDTKAPTYETIEVAAIMHAGMDPQAPSCLEADSREELPATDFTYEEPEPEPQRKPRQGRNPLSGLFQKLSTMFESSAEDDDDTEIN